jgi:hypothetical protein
MVRSDKHLPQQDAILHLSVVRVAQEGAAQTGYAKLFPNFDAVPAQKELVLMGSQLVTRIIKE